MFDFFITITKHRLGFFTSDNSLTKPWLPFLKLFSLNGHGPENPQHWYSRVQKEVSGLFTDRVPMVNHSRPVRRQDACNADCAA